MSVTELITKNASILRLPLVELGHPKNLRPVLEFIASDAPPCVAEALMLFLSFNLQQMTGCSHARALTFMNKLLRFFG